MRLARWEPLQELEQLFEGTSDQGPSWDLAADVYEEKDNIVTKMQLPGVDPEKLDVTFEDDQHVRISGSREEKEETEEKNYYSREIRQGSFERVVRLPVPVDQDKAEADHTDGVLKVTVPKKEETTTGQKKIEVNRK